MKLAKKIGLSLFVLLAMSPVLSEIPAIWKWAGDSASRKFISDQSGASLNISDIQVWGWSSCVYSNRLVKSLNEWNIPYSYYEMKQPTSPEVRTKMSEAIRMSGVNGMYTYPIVKIDDIAIVKNPASMDDVAKTLADKGKLPFQYILYRLGVRVSFILFLETVLFLYCWLAFVAFRLVAGKRKSLSAKGK
jgi:glutaredoxin